MDYAQNIAQLTAKNQLLITENALLNARCEQYAQAHEYLQEQLINLRRQIFGKRSERFVDLDNRQQSLLDGIDTCAVTATIQEPIVVDAATPPTARTRTRKAKADLPRRIEIIPLPEHEKLCSCGACKNVIRYEVKQLIHYVPAVLEILEQRREVAACPNECDNSIVSAKAPLQILPKTKATPEFLSFLVVSKLEDRQPLYHLERQLKSRHGIDCSRQTMARWVIDLMEPLQPIYNLLKDYIIDYDVAACDATTLQVLKEPGRAAETKSQVYCMRGGAPNKSVVLYEYNATEHSNFVQQWFADFSGYLHTDAGNVFDRIGKSNATLVNCNAHARRSFEPIAKANKNKGVAKQAMQYFNALYKIEREAKSKNLTPQQRYQLRLDQARPIMEEFNSWLDQIYPTVLPQSALGKAINYCIKYRKGLMRYLEDGRLEIDNNLTKQKIKPLVIARKNFLFCDSVNGAKALCLHLGLIQTAKLHSLDPFRYYVTLLKSIPHCKTIEDYEQLLPWNIFNYVIPLNNS